LRIVAAKNFRKRRAGQVATPKAPFAVSHLKLNWDVNSRRGSQYGKAVIEKLIHTERARQAVMHGNDLAKMALEDIVRVTAPRSTTQKRSTVYPPDVTFDAEAMNDLHAAATDDLAEFGIKSQSQRDAFAGTFRVLGLAWNPGIYRQFHPHNVLRLPVPFAQSVTKSLLRLYDSFVDHNDRPIDFMFEKFMDEVAEGMREREVAFDKGEEASKDSSTAQKAVEETNQVATSYSNAPRNNALAGASASRQTHELGFEMTSGARQVSDTVEIPADRSCRSTTSTDQPVTAIVAGPDERTGLDVEIELEKRRKKRRAILAMKKARGGLER
jgi:hypothetical protein